MSHLRRKLLSIVFTPVEHSIEIISDDTYIGKYFYCTCQYDGVAVAGTWIMIAGSSYASLNENGKVTILAGTVQQLITIQCTYAGITATRSITVSYDNQLNIECASVLTGTSGNAIALYNGEVVTPTWAVSSGSSYISIDATGAITIIASGQAIIQAAYQNQLATKTITVVYESNTSSSTEVNEDGSITTTTTTTTENPDGSTTESSTSQTLNEDGSTSSTTSETTTNQDGSSETSSTTVNLDGSSSQTQSTTTAPDQSGSTTTNTTTENFDPNGDLTGSTENETTNNSDGSSASTTTNYDADGDPVSGVNNTIDVQGNSNTQTLEYDDEGNPTVTSYTVDTSNNPLGEEDITGTGVGTEFTPFDGSSGFVIHYRFYSKKSEQPVPPLVNDPEDKNYHYNMIIAKSPWTPWYGFHLRWTGNPQTSTDTKLHFGCTFEGDTKTNDVTKNQNSNGIYDITITYDPNGDADGYYFKVRDNINNNWWRRDKKLFRDMENLEVNLGFGISQAGTPYRYANIKVYDFSVNKLTT